MKLNLLRFLRLRALRPAWLGLLLAAVSPSARAYVFADPSQPSQQPPNSHTYGSAYFSESNQGFVLSAGGSGTVIFDSGDSAHPLGAAADFQVAFDVTLRPTGAFGGSGQAAFAFNYGSLADANLSGDISLGSGLVISCVGTNNGSGDLTLISRVTLMGNPVAAESLDASVEVTRFEASFDRAPVSKLTVTYRGINHAAGGDWSRSFTYDLPSWSPAASWRFGLSGATSGTQNYAVLAQRVALSASLAPWFGAPLQSTSTYSRTSFQDMPDSFQFQIGSHEGVNPGNITVTASSSNQDLFTSADIVVTSPAADTRAITLTPRPGAYGDSTITLRIDPGGGLPAATATYVQSVSRNIPPTIATLGPTALTVQQPLGFSRSIPFTIGSPRWPLNKLHLTTTFGGSNLEPHYAFFEPRGNNGADWNLVFTVDPASLTPTPPNSVTVTVTDGSGDTASARIPLNVYTPNLPPVVLGGGSALALNPQTDYLNYNFQFGVQPGITDAPSSSEFTIEAWVFPLALIYPDYGMIAGIGNLDVQAEVFNLAVRNDGSPVLTTFSGNFTAPDATFKVTTNRWHHLAGVIKGNAVWYYVDGQLSAQGTLKTPQGAVAPPINLKPSSVTIGNAPANYSVRPFFGYLDNIRVWNVARSAADIFTYHDKLVPPNAGGLIRDFRCDEGFLHFDGNHTALADAGVPPGGILHDSSSVGAHVNLVGYPTYVPGVSLGTTVNVPEDQPATFGLASATSPTQVWGDAGLTREIFFGPVTNALAPGLQSSDGWPDAPATILASGSGLEWPPGGPVAYGQRLRGWILPPESGPYTFSIASANEAVLLLSSDASPDNLKAIARSPATGVGFRRFDINPALQTATATLQAGQRYSFEVRHQADAGNNGSPHLSVQWRLPSGLVESPIPPHRFQPAGAPPQGESLAFLIDVPPDAGSLSVSNGVASYNPLPNFFGTDTFIYRAVASGITSAPVVVNLNVLNRDDTPVVGSGNALRLDGAPATASTINELNLRGSSFTLELWARRTSTQPPPDGSTQTLWHLGPDDPGSTNSQAVLAWHPDGTLQWLLRNQDRQTTISSGISLLDTNWHHLQVVYDADAGTGELFRDAVSLGKATTTVPPLNEARLHLGALQDRSNSIAATIDEVRLWTRALSIEELVQRSNTPLAGNEEDLFVYLRLDEGNGLLSRDSGPPKPGGATGDLALIDPITWISGVTNFSTISIPQNSPGQRIFLPALDPDGDVLTWQIIAPTPSFGRLRQDLNSPGTFTYIPNTNYSGPDLIRYQVTAGGRTSLVATLNLSITRQPIPPVISSLPDVEFEEEDPPVVVPFTIGDVNDPTGDNLALTARSSNPSLLPTNNITFGGSGNERTLTLAPVEGEVGTATITVEVSNGLVTSSPFQVRVNPRLAFAVVNAGEETGRPTGIATALNESGQLAGWVYSTASSTNSRPFFYAGYGAVDTTLLVPNLGGATGGAFDLNNQGTLVGASLDALGATRAFAFNARTNLAPIDLGVLATGNHSVATSVNDSGLVVGYALLGDGTSRAFLAGSQPITPLALTNGYAEMWATAVNNAGEIVGYARRADSGTTNAFLHAEDQTIDLGLPPGASHVVATAINEGGSVFGHAVFTTPPTSRAVRWDNGSWTVLTNLPTAVQVEVTGANRYGQFVGRALHTNGLWRAFLHTDGRTWDLNDLLPGDSDWTLESAAAINDRGQIAATGTHPGGLSQALLLFPATEIGRRVFRPEGTLPVMPTITILPAGSQIATDQAFFWSDTDRKLFAIQPVVAEIRWRTGTYEVVTNLTEFGDTFIRQKFTNEITLPTLSFNVWPADPDLHVVGTPVQVEPNQPNFQYRFVENRYTTADGSSVDATTRTFTSPSTGYSVLHYLKTDGRNANSKLQPHQFTVVRSVPWNEPGLLVTNVAWTIGSPVTNPLHDDYPGLNGFVLFTNAPYDATGAFAAYDRASRTGPILPVNTRSEAGNLVVVWYHRNRFGVAWSSQPYQYDPHWPTNAPTLVIASQLGSGPLSPTLHPQAHVYHQPDPSLPGFNPNEEHALISADVLYALRNDLNARINPKASDPFVLLKFRDPASGEWRMKPFAVVDELAPWFFRYDGVAGTEIQPPLPLSALPLMTRNNRVASGPAWQDLHGRFYPRAAGFTGGEGDIVMQWYYPMQTDFFYHLDLRNGLPEYLPGDAVPWLDRRPNGITGDPVNVTYAIEWPAFVPPLQIGQSVTTGGAGLPDITDMAAATVIFDGLDPDSTHPEKAAARLYDPLSPRTLALDEGFTFPPSIQRSVDPATGLEFFPDLPYVLRVRFFHDPREHLLGFRGYVYSPSDGGAALTLVNIMSSRERQTIAALDTSGGEAFSQAVQDLFHLTRNPNRVDLDGDGQAEEQLLTGLTMQSVTNAGVVTQKVVRETLLGPKALSAGQPIPALDPPKTYSVQLTPPGGAVRVGPKFSHITDSFTMEFWVRPEASRDNTAEEISGVSGQGGQRFAIFPTQGGIHYGLGHAGAGVSVGNNGISVFLHSDNLICSPLVYSTNLVGWHHVALVYRQRQPLLYLDGALVHVGLASSQTIHPSADLSSDGVSANFGPFAGSISDVRIWNYPRSDTEIAANRDQHLTGAEDGLAGLWRFLENQGTTVADASPAGNMATFADQVAWISDAPPRAPARRYVVLAENNDPSLGGLPVSLHLVHIDDSLARGNLALIQPDNVLDERVTLRHTADFAGEPDSFVFQWYYQLDAQGFDPAAVPGVDDSGSITNLGAWVPYANPNTVPGVNDLTLGTGGESSLLSLSDTWWVMRYGVSLPDGSVRWSGWAGDPAGTDAAPRAMLVPGWIKRVLGGINLFAQRSSDFGNNAVNTLASTIAEAGPRYERDVALNPGALDNFGLIETYETVLRRGRSLSIDGTPPVDFSPADEALLLAAGRIADLYLLHANEAFADAADPTIGLTTDSTSLGSVASSVFAFENQLGSLLEEELALLRGRDGRSGGVGAAPVYNRLLWNFTGSDGEVAYVAAYGIPDQDGNGFINAADARILYPQGHGDAWGHYLTALTTYYNLLRHPNFTWTPRAQSTLVAGIPIQVNYEDERRFALAAAAKARTGAEIVDRTWRLDSTDDPVALFRGDFDPDPQRAWSPTDWARRTALGAYFDWVTGNAILPPVDPDPTHTGIQRVDRTTVLDLVQIVAEANTVLSILDRADAGLNPAGLAPGTVPFDIDPDILRTGFTRVTHFEQIYARALQTLQNAEVTFNRASALSSELRKQQNSVSDFSVAVANQESAFLGDLIALFGYPHHGNLGAGRPYPADYQGPDIAYWMYIDTLDVTPENTPPGEGWTELKDTFTGLTADWGTAFSEDVSDLLQSGTNHWIEVEYPISTADYAFQAPQDWGKRRAEGQLQANLRALVLAQSQSRQALTAYKTLIDDLEEQADLLALRYGLRRDQLQFVTDKVITQTTFNALILTAKTAKIVSEGLTDTITDAVDALIEAIPDVEGLSDDVLAPIAAAAYLTGNFTKSVPKEIAEVAEIAEAALDLAKEEAELGIELDSETKSQDFELTERVKDLEGLVRQEPSLRLDLFNANQAILQAARDLEATLAQGQRLLVQRTLFRQITAGTIQADRYRDLGLRIFRNDALQKYEAQFELASRYVHLAAAAYDYELNLGTASGAGSILGAQIVRERSLGELADGEPIVGRVGLASILGRLRQNFDVLKGQLGLNNDRPERTRFSLRTEAFRMLPCGTNETDNASWRALLQQAVVTNLWEVPEFRRYCRPFAPESDGPQPGLVLRFATTIQAGRNFFDKPLCPLDSNYDPSEFATRIKSLAVWFSDYDTTRLASRPRTYLVPVGTDRMRAANATDFTVHNWQVLDQRIPVPFPITDADLASAGTQPVLPTADGAFSELRRHSAFRAYPDGTFDIDEFNESTRLVGRSVWNTQWILIIPGAYLLGDPQEGIDRLVNSLTDIKLYFQTYSLSGN